MKPEVEEVVDLWSETSDCGWVLLGVECYKGRGGQLRLAAAFPEMGCWGIILFAGPQAGHSNNTYLLELLYNGRSLKQESHLFSLGQ